MAVYTTIDDSSVYFQVSPLYSGGSGAVTVTFDGNSDLQLDLLWAKCRSTAHSHAFMDTQRITSGDYLPVFGDTTDTEQTGYTDELNSIGSDTYVVGDQPHSGASGKTYMGYAWKANGGSSSASAGESGSNVAYNFQVNTTSKFMINAYTGLGSDATLNLGNHLTPEFLMIKNLDQADPWVVYHHKNTAYPWTDYLVLNTDAATADDQEMWEDTVFAADEINIGTNHDVNADGEKYICYAWAGVQGYSKFGGYTGNGNADGPFIYTGFSPAFIIFRRTDSSGHWIMKDNKRNTYNPATNYMYVDAADVDATPSFNIDFLSNGVKLRGSDAQFNADDGNFVYAAWAQNPFVTSGGVPATAR